MIKLNKITDYAVVILGLLSSRYPNKFSTSKISEDTGLPVPTVAKVCKLLNKANLILAGRGANGGYYCEILNRFDPFPARPSSLSAYNVPQQLTLSRKQAGLLDAVREPT